MTDTTTDPVLAEMRAAHAHIGARYSEDDMRTAIEQARQAERDRIRQAVFARYARFAALEEEVPEWLDDLLDGD